MFEFPLGHRADQPGLATQRGRRSRWKASRLLSTNVLRRYWTNMELDEYLVRLPKAGSISLRACCESSLAGSLRRSVPTPPSKAVGPDAEGIKVGFQPSRVPTWNVNPTMKAIRASSSGTTAYVETIRLSAIGTIRDQNGRKFGIKADR